MSALLVALLLPGPVLAVDTASPIVFGPTIIGSPFSQGSPVTVSADASDPAGVDAIEFALDGGGWNSASASDGIFGGTTETATSGVNGAAVELASGPMAAHSCALTGTGRILCWGTNTNGQLGDGTGSSSPTPVYVRDISDGTDIAVGLRHTCAVGSRGAVYCWGYGGNGVLGSGSFSSSSVPVAVPDISTATAITAGENHTCALLADGSVRCWGDNVRGQLGVVGPSSSASPAVVAGLSGVVAIAAGGFHTCAVLGTGRVSCWGYDASGQLGYYVPAPGYTAIPGEVGDISTATAVTAGYIHTCALLEDDSVRCWGEGSSGQLGDGYFSGGIEPVAVKDVTTATMITASNGRTCARLSDGTARCWGGLTGDGSFERRPNPVSVLRVPDARSISSGLDHVCVLLRAGRIRCWGNNETGQLGTGALGGTYTVPQNTIGLPSALWIGNHTVCVRARDSLGNLSSGSACAGFTVSAESAVLYSGYGDGAGPCAMPAYRWPYSSIQDTIDDAFDGDTVHICAGGYDLNRTLRTPQWSTMWIEGDGPEQTVLDGNGNQILYGSQATVFVAGLTLQNGAATAGGAIDARLVIAENCWFYWNRSAYRAGAISADGVWATDSVFFANQSSYNGGNDGGAIYGANGVTVTRSVFQKNKTGQLGGAIRSDHAVIAIDSEFEGNEAAYGGAIYAADVTVTGSTFDLNKASQVGGAIGSWAPVVVANSTFFRNSAGTGGAIWAQNDSTVIANKVTNSTFVGNQATTGGGAIYGVTTKLANSIIDASGGTAACSGSFTDLGGNLATDASCGLTAPSSAVVTRGSLLLGDFGDYGGPTATIPIVSGSVAVDAGVDSLCSASPVNGLDQRGASRGLGLHCDAGAYESGVPFLTRHPADLTVTSGQSASFTAAAAGYPTPTIQWQVSTPVRPTWTNLSGATASTITVVSATPGDSGSRYRAVFTNAEGASTSDAATLTVATIPVLVSQPQNISVTAGATASFTSEAMGTPTPTVRWQSRTNVGSTWADVAGATSPTYSLSTTPGDTGRQFRAVYTNVAGSATTNTAILTVWVPPVVVTQPQSATVTEGATASFVAAASGYATPTVQWELSLNGAFWWDASGATSSTYTRVATLEDTGLKVRAVFTNLGGSTTTAIATLTVTAASDSGGSGSGGTGGGGAGAPSAKLPQAIAFILPTSAKVGTKVLLDATTSSGLPVTLVSRTGLVCGVSSRLLTILKSGICTVEAAQAGNETYSPASSVTRTMLAGTLPGGRQRFGIGTAIPTLASATVKRGISVVDQLTTTRALRGVTVSLWMRPLNGAWRRIATARVDLVGKARYRWAPLATADYQWRIPPSGPWAPASTAVARVAVR